MDELEQEPAVPAERTPISLAEVFDDLQGFGIEESEEILTISSGPKSLKIRFSNISTDEDLTSNLATEESKGYAHFQEIKAEILSRAITWVNGVSLRTLTGADRLVIDPRSGAKRDYQVVMRDTIKGWGVEVMQLLWKALMVHVQKIEDRMFESLPDKAVMTEVERRYRDRIAAELEAETRSVLSERIAQLVDNADVDDEEPATS